VCKHGNSHGRSAVSSIPEASDWRIQSRPTVLSPTDSFWQTQIEGRDAKHHGIFACDVVRWHFFQTASWFANEIEYFKFGEKLGILSREPLKGRCFSQIDGIGLRSRAGAVGREIVGI
jgi:hypothetical protein